MKEGKKSKFGPTGPWFRMPRELTLSSELNPYQYRMLSIMLERDDLHQSTKNHDRFWSYTDWLVSHSGMGRTKAKETLNELEEMGFITKTSGKNKRRANIFHINWDFINAYKAPNTRDDELEDMEEPDFQETVQPVSVSMPREDYQMEEFDTSEEEVPYDEAPDNPDEEVLEDYEMDMSVDEPETEPSPVVPEPQQPVCSTQTEQPATLPSAEEWMKAEGCEKLWSKVFPKLRDVYNDGTQEEYEDLKGKIVKWMQKYVKPTGEKRLWGVYVYPAFRRYLLEEEAKERQRV